MTYVIGILLTLLSMIILTYPFFRARREVLQARNTTKAEEISHARQKIFDEIRRLNLDLDVNNITTQDHQQRTDALRRAAAINMYEEDQLVSKSQHDAARIQTKLDNQVEEDVSLIRFAKRQNTLIFQCTQCGRIIPIDGQPCSKCGALNAAYTGSDGKSQPNRK